MAQLVPFFVAIFILWVARRGVAGGKKAATKQEWVDFRVGRRTVNVSKTDEKFY
ncbi:MAG: hypothetical protein U1E42_10990 [Rhodospirillales bacterium]